MSKITADDIKDIMLLMNVKTIDSLKKAISKAKANTLKKGDTRNIMQGMYYNGISWEMKGRPFLTPIKGSKIGMSRGHKINKAKNDKVKKDKAFVQKFQEKSEEVEEW